MQPGDRLVCAFIQPLDVGAQFKKWPLHVTVVPWFRFKDGSEQIAHGLQEALKPIQPFAAEVGEEVRFGPKKNRPANLLLTSRFTEIEQRTRAYLHKKRAWLVDETTKVKRPYKPHITFQEDEHPTKGDIITCD